MNTFVSPFIRLLALVCTLPLSACASLLGNAIEGTVLEQGTNKPIPGAIVIVRWGGALPAFAEARSVCVHIETATTDAMGGFRTAAWRAPSSVGPAPVVQAHIGPAAYAYKSGYEYVDTQGETVYLKPFTGTRGERLKYLERIEYATRCPSAKESEKNFLPFYQALYDEATRLAVTRDEKKIADGFLSNIEIIEFGYEAAMKRAIERAEARKRQQ